MRPVIERSPLVRTTRPIARFSVSPTEPTTLDTVQLFDSSSDPRDVGIAWRAWDPGVVRLRVTQYFERASECIGRFGGTVEKFAGDAVMAAFGVPQAHEDDAERAVRAAFAVRESVEELGLEVRIGIESGELLV